MTNIAWDQVGDRRFETGLDRGVLYANGGIGVPWNGLVSLNETTTGGSTKPYYIDGYKYQNVVSPEEFGATIDAFTYPDEFMQCDGTASVGGGLFAMQQRRLPFGLTYRTRIGNDVDGVEHGYKYHLIYNAVVSPASKNFASLGDTPEPITFSWPITSKAIRVAGYKPISHLIVDTTKVAAPLLAALLGILYGTESAAPRLPLPAEVFTLFGTWPTLYVVDNGNGTFTVSGPDDIVHLIDSGTFQIIASTATDNGNGSFTVTSY
jgi:hypothetical protein